MINDGLCHYEENLWNEEDDEKSWVSRSISIFRPYGILRSVVVQILLSCMCVYGGS